MIRSEIRLTFYFRVCLSERNKYFPDFSMFIFRDTVDPNPGVRSIAISTLCSIPGLEMYTVNPIIAGLVS